MEKRLCSKCWSEIDDLDEEASYLGITKEALIAIRYKDNGGNRVLFFKEDYHARKKMKKRKKAKRLRGNKYAKFYDWDRRTSK